MADDIMKREKEREPLRDTLNILRNEGKVLVALLYGSYAVGIPNVRSDIDLAVFMNAGNEVEEIKKMPS
ncbi:MAG: nucleotidyltransferase domain-containing protein [Candidatus Brocadiaceae bacterium]|nr:nucleotidyltransferase domain-containing protein [Candidatus Brocadiaceae bacterium]